MKSKVWGKAATAAIALVLSACVGSSGGGSSSSASLTGSWGGILEHYESSGPMGAGWYYSTTTATVDGSNITDLTIGSFFSGLTGTIANVQTNIYSFTLSNAAEGGFMSDSAGSHVGILDITTGNFGVLEKGASSQPTTFVQSDIAGSWSGYTVQLDDYGDVAQVASSSATVSCPGAGDCTVSGTDMNGSFSGTFPAGNYTAYGVYGGSFTNTVTSGNMYVFMSADKTFASSYACATGYLPPSTYCTYQIWNK